MPRKKNRRKERQAERRKHEPKQPRKRQPTRLREDVGALPFLAAAALRILTRSKDH